MEKLEQIQYFKDRAFAIQSMGEWSEAVETAYWDLKEEIFKTLRLWELEKPPFHWSKEIKHNLYILSLILDGIWAKR